MLGVDESLLKKKTIESFTNFQTLNSLSKCKVVIMKVKYQPNVKRGVVLNLGEFITTQKKHHIPIGLEVIQQELELLTTLSDLHKVV